MIRFAFALALAMATLPAAAQQQADRELAVNGALMVWFLRCEPDDPPGNVEEYFASIYKAFDKHGEAQMLKASTAMNAAYEEWGAQKFCNSVNKILGLPVKKY